MTDRLYIAAKAPRPGLAKTRLAARVGDAAALAVYRAFLTDLAARFCDGPVPMGWYVTPADAWDQLREICGDRDGVRVLDQGEGDWTTRQRRLFAGMPARGETRCVLAASDSPHLPREIVVEAFRLLESHNVVLGPVFDGGYYLIGMNGPHDVLDGIPMSTATVFEQIVERCRRLGLTVGLVEATFDVDGADDLRRLAEELARRDDCPATVAAVRALGLTRVPELAP